MKTHLLSLLALTTLAGSALAQAPLPQPNQPSPGTSPAPMTPAPQTTPRPQPPQAGAMMCGMMQPGQQAQGAGGCSCCSGMMGAQPQRQGMMGGMQMGQAQPAPSTAAQDVPAGPGRMAQMQHAAPGGAGGHAGHGMSPSPSQAGMPGMDPAAMQKMMQDMTPKPDDPASTREFKEADKRMMHDMAVPYTGDADVDLRTHMIPHHQGAIEMARVALRHAKDPETRRMAQKIIDDQEREITEMRDWLSKHGK